MGEIACYCRVSTQEQSLDRQRDATTEYATTNFDVDLGNIRFYRDKSTGTDTERDGYQKMMADVEAGELDVVVVKSISRVSRSNRDLNATVNRCVDNGAGIHFVDEPIRIDATGDDDPMQSLMLQIFGAFAEFEADMIQMRVREGIAARMESDGEYHHGRPPLGFESEDGKLYQTGKYDAIASTLELVRDDELSKRKAAHELDTSRATIDRCLERAELYGL